MTRTRPPAPKRAPVERCPPFSLAMTRRLPGYPRSSNAMLDSHVSLVGDLVAWRAGPLGPKRYARH
jgi:hypothetical protein